MKWGCKFKPKHTDWGRDYVGSRADWDSYNKWLRLWGWTEKAILISRFNRRRICFQTHIVAGSIQFSVGCWTEGLSCLWAVSRRLPSAPRCVVLSIWQHTSWRPPSSKPARESLLARHMKIFCNIVIYVSCRPIHLLLLRNKPHLLILKGRGLYKSVNTRSWGSRGY